MPNTDKQKNKLLHELQEMRKRLAGLERALTVEKNTAQALREMNVTEWKRTEEELRHQLDLALERRLSEEALKESEEKALAITESTTDAIIMIDNGGKIMYWNPSAENIFGYKAEEAMGMDVHSFIAPQAYHAAYSGGFAKFRTSGQGVAVGKTFEFSALRKDGTEFPVELSLSSFRLGGLWHAAAIIRDITLRREMEGSLHEEKRFAESLIANSAVATFVLNRQRKVVFWNRACEELTGISSSLVIGTDEHWKPFYDHKRYTLADIIAEGVFEVVPSLYKKHSMSALIPNALQAEGWYPNLNGKQRYILFNASPILNSRGELTFVIETLQDITERKKAEDELDQYRSRLEELVIERTSELKAANERLECDMEERKQAEEALRRSESRFEEAQRVARIGTWEWNIETDDVYRSNEIYRIFGLEPGQGIHGREGIFAYVHPEDQAMVRQAIMRAIHDKKPYSVEGRIIRQDGTEAFVHSQGKVYFNAEGKPLIMLGNVQDITARKRMEEEVLKIHKLESIGVLAGGIAHDFNNLLSAILGNISLAKLYATPGDKVFERLNEAEKISLRAAGLSKQLLTFSKGGEPVKKVTSISDLIRDAADFALRGSSAKSDIFIAGSIWPVKVDEGQIIQVINNIVINAKQAMPGGGTVRIEAKNRIVNANGVLPLEGNYVEILIEDQGIGISQEYIEKIFDPYFTTKEEGSGLGLATSFSIIKKHGGHLSVSSTTGKGTTFAIYLPALVKLVSDYLPASAKPVSDAGKGNSGLISGRGKILVMDDQDIIRLILGKMLEELGYEAEFAESGEEAIEFYRMALESGQPFDAVLVDLTIRGGMGGKDCIKILSGIDPAIKAIVSSGYADDPIMARYHEFGFKGIMTKPYNIEELSEVLSAVLHGTVSR